MSARCCSPSIPAPFAADAVSRFGVLAQSIETQQGARFAGLCERLKLREKARADGMPTVSDALLKEIEAL